MLNLGRPVPLRQWNLMTLLLIGVGLGCLSLTPAQAERTLESLDGKWQIADSQSATEMPEAFNHTVPVPGLVNLAKPAFPKVDAFISREQMANREIPHEATNRQSAATPS